MRRAGALLVAALLCVCACASAAAAPTPTLPAPTSTPSQGTARPTATAVMTPTVAPSPTLAPTPTSEPLDAPELRGVWVDAFHDGFKTPEQVDRLIAWARLANLNALFVQVRRRGDAYYLRSIEPRTEDPDLAEGFDALEYLIRRAHEG